MHAIASRFCIEIGCNKLACDDVEPADMCALEVSKWAPFIPNGIENFKTNCQIYDENNKSYLVKNVVVIQWPAFAAKIVAKM